MLNSLRNGMTALSVPYVVDEPGRGTPFTLEMEKAAILCLSEAKRRKPTILRRESEELVYISKLHYPLWFVPWRSRCIAVDGLGLSSTTVSHSRAPNVLNFTEDLKKSASSFDLFRRTLKKHARTFMRFSSVKDVVLDAVVGDASVLKVLSSIIEQAMMREETVSGTVLAPPEFHSKVAEQKANSLISEWLSLEEEVDGFKYALQVLNEEMERHKEKVTKEIEMIWEEYGERISEMKKAVEKRIRQLKREEEREIKKATRLAEKKLAKLVAEEKKLRQKIVRLEQSLEEKRRKRKAQKRRYPKRSTTRIDNTIRTYREKITGLNLELRKVLARQETARKEEEQTLRQIEESYLHTAAKEMEKIEILEKGRNLEVSKEREKLQEAEDTASKIESQIKNLIQRKTESLRNLENRTMPFEAEKTFLVGIPFYAVQYKSRRKTRVDVYPPVKASSYEGTLRRIQIAVLSFSLESRLQHLLSPRSTELDAAFFTNLKERLNTDVALKELLSQVAEPNNLLAHPSFRDDVAKGLDALEEEGWLSEKEKENILSIYMKP